jgi:cell division protein FtsB
MVRQTSHKNFIKRLLSSKVFLFFISLALIALVISVGQESYRKHQLTQEINRLKLEIERIEGRNEQLVNLMEYFQEESSLEKEARLKLNLKKPGEKVVILPQPSADESSIDRVNTETVGSGSLVARSSRETADRLSNLSTEIANYWKWWEYFFAPQ